MLINFVALDAEHLVDCHLFHVVDFVLEVVAALDSVVAGPAAIAIGSGVVGIVQLAGASIHVLNTFSIQVGMAAVVVVALALAVLLADTSPLGKLDSAWTIADTLVLSVSVQGHSVVARPASITVGGRVVAIVELACASVHVLDTLSEKICLAVSPGIALGLAVRLGCASPLSKLVSAWRVADTLVFHISQVLLWGISIIARPSSVAISSGVVHVVDLTCTGVHVLNSLGKEIRLALGIVEASALAEGLSCSSPLSELVSTWAVADTLVTDEAVCEHCAHQHAEFLHLFKKYL